MSLDDFSIHEWEKEKMDKLVEDAEKEIAYSEGMEAGISQGIEQNTNATIKAMLENKANYEFISKVTNKTIEEIKEIEKSMKVD